MLIVNLATFSIISSALGFTCRALVVMTNLRECEDNVAKTSSLHVIGTRRGSVKIEVLKLSTEYSRMSAEDFISQEYHD